MTNYTELEFQMQIANLLRLSKAPIWFTLGVIIHSNTTSTLSRSSSQEDFSIWVIRIYLDRLESLTSCLLQSELSIVCE